MMSAIDTEALLQEISSDNPCGEDLEYDPAFIELENIAKGKAEQQIGDSIIEGEAADWKQVQKKSLELLAQTKDIRVLIYLIRSILHMDGLTSFRDALVLLKELLSRYWEQIHPQLDEDDGDPTMRINALVTLFDEESVLRPLRMVPLVQSRMLGSFGLRDISIATGETAPPANYEPVEKSTIDGAFMDADLDDLQASATAATEAIGQITEIESFITDQVGVANAASFSDLTSILKEAQQTLSEQLTRRGVGQADETSDSEAAGDEAMATGGNRSGPALSGQINSRQDVARVLDKITDYYTQYEPTSPVPLLISRVRRLVHMDFMEIMKNLAPDGISQVEMIRGPEDEVQTRPETTEQESNGGSGGSGGSDW
ncbi:MAG: type VI secretion system protein TssA [Candidatus Sedimenticola sp. (ex Thyasira tokunagai)]